MVDKKMWTSWQVLTRISQKVSSSWLIDKKNKKSVNLLIRIDNWKINKNMFSPWLRLAGKTKFCLALNGGKKKKCDKSSHKYPLKVSSPWLWWTRKTNVELLTRLNTNITKKCQAPDYGWQEEKKLSSWQELTRITQESGKPLDMVNKKKNVKLLTRIDNEKPKKY